MTAKIPPDSFAYYVSLGPGRSYEAVGRRFGVTKRAITMYATKEKWSERLAEIEKDVRERIDKTLADELEEMNTRHRQVIRAVIGRAAKALTEFPLRSGMEGVRAADTAIRLERLVAGAPTERADLNVATVTRAEMERFLKPADEDPDAGDEW